MNPPPPPQPPKRPGTPPRPPRPPQVGRAAKAEAIFNSALACPQAEREAFLQKECGDDAGMLDEVHALCAAHEAAGDLMPEDAPVSPEMEEQFARLKPEEAGEMIGPYKLREQIGEGGFGTVWVADQERPIRRRVALKIIKMGMDTNDVIARFEQERQALAMMDHPNIAKVLDAGATRFGRPYFVMELVRGVKITGYCDDQQLSTQERIELFITVCQAVQHAHQKGIIHRDLKPSNILVTINDGKAVPKVIDFGLAKAMQGRLTDATVYTQFQQMIGTPLYMSPEQAELTSLDIDTRSDIYALGVLLYELLTGHTPIDQDTMARIGLDEMRRMIREVDPPRPSMRVRSFDGEEMTSAAKRRHTDAAKLPGALRGDLDWIVMKCIDKDRSRRYDTANGLAADLRRHLNDEPVLARSPTTAYLLGRLMRRNKLAFAAGGAVTAAVLLGLVTSSWQAVRATRAKQEAVAARQEAVANEKKAVEAQASETKLRQQAETQELVARQRAYASDMNVAKQQLDGFNFGRALDLLNRQRPQPGQKDLRGWEWRYLWQQTRSDALFTLCQKSSEIESLAVSADGRWLAVGVAHKGGVSVWDLQTRRESVRLADSDQNVLVTFSPTGPLLAFSSETLPDEGAVRNTLHLWNAATREMVADLPLDHLCEGLAFSQDGKTLVTSTGRRDGHITLWRVSDGTKIASFAAQQATYIYFPSFAVTSDLGLAAYAMPQGRIRVVDLRDGKELWTAVAAKNLIIAMAFSPDGKTLASAAGFSESDIRLWDVATGKEIGELEGHGSFVSSLLFWPDGKKLASASGDQTIRIWDVVNRKCLDVLRGHRLEVWRLALLPDGKTLVSGCKDGTVCFWDTSVTHPRQPYITIPEKVAGWCFTPDGQSVLTLNQKHQVALWTGIDFQRREPWPEIGTNFDDIIFSDNGGFLATGSTNGITQVWDVSRRVLWRQWTNTTGQVRPITFLEDGNKLITESESDQLDHEWDLATGRELRSWAKSSWKYLDAIVDFPTGERYMERGFNNSEIRVKNLANGQVMKTNLDFLESNGAVVSPDGKLFAVVSGQGYARVWDTTTWRAITTLRGYLVGVLSVAFSPDGQRLATGSDKQQAVRLWDTESWQDVLTLETQEVNFVSTAFSRDGNGIGSSNGSGTLYIWRAPSWAEINAAEAKEKAETKLP
jgi:WD40 repeat protein/serine/threonine protein kinase